MVMNDAGRNRTEILQPDDLDYEIVCPDCPAGDKSSASAVPVQGIPRQAKCPHPSAAKPWRIQRGDQQDRYPWSGALRQKVGHRLRYPQGHLRSAAPVSSLFQSPGCRSISIGVQGVFGIFAEQGQTSLGAGTIAGAGAGGGRTPRQSPA